MQLPAHVWVLCKHQAAFCSYLQRLMAIMSIICSAEPSVMICSVNELLCFGKAERIPHPKPQKMPVLALGARLKIFLLSLMRKVQFSQKRNKILGFVFFSILYLLASHTRGQSSNTQDVERSYVWRQQFGHMRQNSNWGSRKAAGARIKVMK